MWLILPLSMINIPGFEIIEKTGEGRTGAVWKAKQLSLDRIVAIKVLNPDLAQRPEMISKFLDDARSAATLKHNNIVQVYDVGEYEGTYYYVMEHVNGDTLLDILEENESLSPMHALKIALALADALRDAWHKHRITHGEIKPGNIMLDSEGNVKLADLGLAKKISQETVQQMEGTLYYISPELAQGLPDPDCRADMYSLGALLYDMLTGTMPFADYEPIEAMHKHITDQLDNPRDIAAVPMGAVQLVTRLMMKNPGDRYQSWDDVITDINKVRKGGVLLAGQSSSGGISTVRSTHTASQHKKTSRGHIARIHARATDDSQGVSPLIQVPAWLLMAMWWIGFAFYLYRTTPRPQTYHAPTVPPVPRQEIPAPPPPRKKTPQAEQPKKTPRKKASGPVARLPVEKKIQAEEKPKEITTPDIITQKPEATPPLPANDPDILRIKQDILKHILNRDFNTAQAIVGAELEYQHSAGFEKEIGALYNILGDMNNMDSTVLSCFRKKRGRSVRISHKGKYLNLLINKVTGDQINATLISSLNGKEVRKGVSFKVAHMDPKEILRWLGTPSSPADFAVQFVLYRQAGDYTKAAALAGQCGPLSDIFKQSMNL